MWHRHWNLSRDPFLASGPAFVSTATHEEAVARVVATFQDGRSTAVLRGPRGCGKTSVLNEAIRRVRGPGRRLALVRSPVDGASVLAGLGRGLGRRVLPGLSLADAWSSLRDALRICHWQKTQAILVVDGAENLDAEAVERLASLSTGRAALVVGVRTEGPLGLAWPLAVRLRPLLASETRRYVSEKLRHAGRNDPAFTPRALDRLHDLTQGVPAGIDRLGSLALMAGAFRGLELVPPDVVDGVAMECEGQGIPTEEADEAGWSTPPVVC
ncbi:MAG: ATP-binding protein [Isosphaeraceae bacterium]